MKKIIQMILFSYEEGLLIIPGRVRITEDETVRLHHEYRVIRSALNRGQPLLGLCAGAWRVFEQMLIWTKHSESMAQDSDTLNKWHRMNETLVDVRDHNYRGGMLRLDARFGNRAINNTQIHDTIVIEGSDLHKIMQVGDNTRFTVNSVHWKAVNPSQIPLNMRESAYSASNPDFHKKTRQGNQMKPEEGTIEAFESIYGAPIIGCQWHPEGYSENSQHANLLKNMAKAGDAYAAKRKMLRELSHRIPS